MGLKVTDWISIEYSTEDPDLASALEEYREYIMEETRSVSLRRVPFAEKQVNINGRICRITTRKVENEFLKKEK